MLAAWYFPSIKHNHNKNTQEFSFHNIYWERFFPYNVSATLWSHQYQQCHWTSPPVIISPPSLLSIVFHRYFSISFCDRQGSNTARQTCASIRYFSCGPLSSRACVCVQLLLYMFWAQHKIISQHSQNKCSTKPLTKPLDLPNQNGNSSALVLTSSHPIGHSEIHTLWALHDVFWPTTTLIHGLQDSTIQLRRSVKKEERNKGKNCGENKGCRSQFLKLLFSILTTN